MYASEVTYLMHEIRFNIFLGFFKYQEVKGKESGSVGSRVCMIAEIDQIHVTQFAEPTLVNKSIFIRD